jgi:two-component system, cell cycle sensor histidine kinase and response regulator CckA
MGSTTANDSLGIGASSQTREQIQPSPSDEHSLYQVKDQAGAPEPPAPGQDYLSLLARATNDAVRDLDLTSNRIVWPQGLHDLLGYNARSTSTDLAFWTERIHPEDRARIAASLRAAVDDNSESWNGEYRFQHADGSYLHLLERAVIVRDEQQRAIRLVGSLMDITAHKQLHDQLYRSQKMEAFGQLAGGAAHDFSNYLTTILGYSDLLLSGIAPKNTVTNHVTEIRKAAVRASHLTAQLLAFSRQQNLEAQVLEINSFISGLERSVLRLLGENITVTCDLHHEKNGAHVKVDPGQLTQVVLNLALNARDAMPNGGALTIQTSVANFTQDRQWEDRHLRAGPEPLSAGEYVVITVRDNGAGMKDEVKAHLFEPFFTTKREGGLGLAASYGIVRQYGGRIVVESDLAKGTQVDVYLPRVAPPAYRRPHNKKMPTGTETILVLEDDVAVRHISVRVLRSLGYNVIEASDGDHAQRCITQRPNEDVDLVLSDIVMPQMSGRHFAEWLRKTSPRTKIVLVSGYLDESEEVNAEPGMFFLPKPFDPEQLAQSIRQALDS